MEWYIAKIVYRILVGDHDVKAQFNEQLRLITADDATAALNKAAALGKQEQFSFYNNNQQLVEWKFIDVTELILLNLRMDGAEVYSTIKEVGHAELYLNLINDHSSKLNNSICNSLVLN